ncbi:MAG: hypothetical protein ABSH47_27845 [Bryobacteraceae bacterium]|jgi:hypothetical protein
MTIEIRKPELEALIRERMRFGVFQNVEDVLIQALRSSPLPEGPEAGIAGGTSTLTGADLVAAMQASPCKEIDLEAARHRLPVRDVVF